MSSFVTYLIALVRHQDPALLATDRTSAITLGLARLAELRYPNGDSIRIGDSSRRNREGFWAYEIAFRHPTLFRSVGGHSAFFAEGNAPPVGPSGWNGRWVTTPRDSASDTLRVLPSQRAQSRDLVRSHPIEIAEIPFSFPAMRQMLIFNAARANDPGLMWLRTRVKEHTVLR